MKEQPILMSPPMVRAILAGLKTQTRRVVKGDVNGYEGIVTGTVAQERGHLGMHCFIRGDESVYQRCPYGAPGDRLWVRETHYRMGRWIQDVTKPGKPRWRFRPSGGTPGLRGIRYQDEPTPLAEKRTDVGWHRRPSLFMPRWASRLVLEITAVRVERLLAISVEDCFEEGIEAMRCPQCHLACYGLPGWGHDDVQKTPNEAYWHLWDQINESRGYGRAKNPWCWVITFKRIEEARKAA